MDSSELTIEPKEDDFVSMAKCINVQKCEVEKYYDILEEIGKGRFGVVHRCLEKETGKIWAAKCVRAIRKKDRDEIKREVELMSELEHPMLLQCGGAFEGISNMTIILEYVSGGELFERIISDDFEFCESDAVIFLRQICLGVQHMHKLNIVHLDLKPENIMCMDKRSNRIKLIDFGLARKLIPGDSLKVMFGTPEFIAPEVINYDPVTTATDMWSVGVVCYILLSGLSPFLGDSDVNTLNNVTRADWDFDDEAFDSVSEDAKAFIEALLVKLPRKRNDSTKCLQHQWLAGDTRLKETNRLCTDKLKGYVAKRRWQKTAIALRAIHRMNVMMMFGSKSEPKCPESATANKITNLDQDEEIINHQKSENGTRSRLKRKNSIVEQVRQKFEQNNNVPCSDEETSKVGNEKPKTVTTEVMQTAPVLLDSLKVQHVGQGGNTRLVCKVNGYPKPTVSWFKDGDIIVENIHFKIEFDSICRYSLIINDMDDNDFGNYTIEASNKLGMCKCSTELRKKDLLKEKGKISAEEGHLGSREFLLDKKSLTGEITVDGKRVTSTGTLQKHKDYQQKTTSKVNQTITDTNTPDKNQLNLITSEKRKHILDNHQSLGTDVTDRVISPESLSLTSSSSILFGRNLVKSSTIKSLVAHWKESAAKSKSTRIQFSRTPGKLSTNIVQRFSTTEIKTTTTQDRNNSPEKKQGNEQSADYPDISHDSIPHVISEVASAKEKQITKSHNVPPKGSIPIPRSQSAATSPSETTNKKQTTTKSSRSRSSSIKSPSQRLPVPCGQESSISSKFEAKPNKNTSIYQIRRKSLKTTKDISEIRKRFSATGSTNRNNSVYSRSKENTRKSTINNTPNKTKEFNTAKVTLGKTRVSPTSVVVKNSGSNNKDQPVSPERTSTFGSKDLGYKKSEVETPLKVTPKKKETKLSPKDTLKKTENQTKRITEPRVLESTKSSIVYAKQKLQEPKKMSARRTIELSSGRSGAKGIGAIAAKFETKGKIETSPAITGKSVRNEPSFASRFQEKVNDDINRNGKGKDVTYNSPVKKPIKPPVFGVKPKRESSRAGGKASFHCTAFGMSKPDVTWIFNGTVLENSKRHTIHVDKGIYYLDIIDLVLEDAGTYICRMENAAGSVEVPVDLTVRDNQKRFTNGLTPTSSPSSNSKSPSIASSTKLNAFQKFNDLCKTNGKPSTNGVQKSAERFKHSEPVKMETKKEVSSTSIKLSSTVKQNDEPKVNKLQTKTYKFELKRDQANAKPKTEDHIDSSPVTTTKTKVTKTEETISPKRSTTTPTTSKALTVGESPKRASYTSTTSKFTEIVESATPKRTSLTTNTKVSTVEESSPPNKTSSKSVIQVSTVEDSFSPKDLTSPKRTTLTLTPKVHHTPAKVQQPPQFTSRPKSQTIRESRSAKFICTIAGDPSPVVTWMKDGKAITEKQRINILENDSECTLEIDDVVQTDGGRYSCVLTNPAGKATASCQLTVQGNPSTTSKKELQFPPKFLRKLSDLKCKDAGSVCFECRVSGTPTPKISWFFEGKPINQDDVYQISFDELVAKLSIAEVFPEDSGMYTCTLTNLAGTISSTAKLEVEESIEVNGGGTNGSIQNDRETTPETVATAPVKTTPKPIKPLTPIIATTAPEFVKELTDVTVEDGAPLTLKVEVKGTPLPTAMWFFKDEEIIEEDDFKLVSDGSTHSLVIAEVYPEDAGTYTCVISNSVGKASNSCKVLVNESGDVGVPPHFIQKPHQMNIDEGTMITLTCKVDGDPEPNVFWYKESRNIQPSDRVKLVTEGFSHSLRIPAAIVTDTGSYTCVAKNEVGEEKCTVSVMVHQIEDEHTDFRSLLKSRPKLQKMDNISQNEEENEAEQLDFRHVLNKSKSEEDETPAPIKEAEAEQLDFRHLLTRHVQTKQHPKFTNELSDVVVDEGSAAVLLCSVTGTPTPTIIWKFKGKEIKESKYFRMTYEGNVAKLSISETFAEDEGEYVCLASNSAGTARSMADLQVKVCDDDEPELTKDTNAEIIGTTKANDEVDSTFHSPVSAKVKAPIANAVGQKVASFTMNASAKPFGETSSKMPNVSPPEFIEELCDEPIIEGSAARLECRLIGDPEPVVYWYKDGKELKEGRKYSFEFDDDDIVALVIKETTMRDLGKYACKAVNSLGTVECSAQLIIEAPPKIEKYERNLIISAGKDIEITCKISGTPEPDIEWYRGKKEVVEGGRIEMEDVDDDTMLFIRNAKQDDSGIYKLVLTNDLGTDSCTISVSVVDKPDPPTGKPVASNVSRTSLTLSWSGSPYDGGSIITGYVVEMRKANEGNWAKLTTAKSTSYVVRGLVPESNYTFRIRSENAYGVSDPGSTSDPVRTTESKVQKEETRADSGDEGESTFESRHVVVKSGDIKNYYDIQEQVGKGRFGIVHKCMEKATGKMWAAKFIKTKASDKESVKAEIEIMNELKHPKLIQCVDAFETAREIIMVLEFVRGGELFERVIDDDFILTEKDVIMFMRQICSGVKHMHSQNILHLDLKPENILCTDTTGNAIKLIDFGLARKFDPKQAVKVMFGTPEFVAPEVVNYEKIGYKTDMWSVGVICYILLSGLSPFMGDNDAETLSAVTMAEWDFEDESFDEISDEAKDFIEKLLIKNKDKRMSATDCLEHKWLTKDTNSMKTTQISTAKLKKFVARRRWQKTANAVRAISRMASLSMFSTRSRSASQEDNNTSGGLTPFSSILKSKREEAKILNNNISKKGNDTEVDINLNDTNTPKSRRNRKSVEGKSSSVDSDESPAQKRSPPSGLVKKLSTDSFSKFESKPPKSLSYTTDPESSLKIDSPNRASGEQKVLSSFGQRGSKDCPGKEGKPKFLKKIRSTTVLEGQNAQFDCIVIGNPLPEVTWYQDGLELPENTRYSVEKSNNGTCSLRIKNVVEYDDAEYTVNATNDNGEITCSAELVVELK